MSEVRNIVVLGRRNAGKSSLVNLLTGQQVSIVSSVKGTTTDPVRKRMEVPGVGPCNIIDTAGIDDSGSVGSLRSERSRTEALLADLALLLFTGNSFLEYEIEMAMWLKSNAVPFIIVHNQEDIESLQDTVREEIANKFSCPIIQFSCKNSDDVTNAYLKTLFEAIAHIIAEEDSDSAHKPEGKGDGVVPLHLAGEGSRVLLVCPIDKGAPAGRLILPQVNTIRSVLDNKAIITVVQPSELNTVFGAEFGEEAHSGKNEFETICREFADTDALLATEAVQRKSFDLVITDSQVFAEVAAVVPADIPIGSFSMLMARKKGPFKFFLDSVSAIDSLKDEDLILILESCTHHASCDDIGRVKLPFLLQQYTGKHLNFEFVSGIDDIPVPKGGKSYSLAIQCGGCMATYRQVHSRVKSMAQIGVPVTNYGLAIAYMKGLFKSANFREFLDRLTSR